MAASKRIISIVASTCVCAALALGVGFAQAQTADQVEKTLAATQTSTVERQTAPEGDDGTQEAGTDAVLNANAILEETEKLIDGGFEVPEGWDALQSDAASTTATDAEFTLEEAESLPDGSYKYLSEYTPIVSNVGWSTRKEDVNFDGNRISLIVNGTRTYFYKGVCAHASATLVYDFGADCPYDRFETYMGIDASRGSNGYAKIEVYSSTDNATWTRIDYSFLGNGQKEAAHVVISLEGIRYLKFVCDPQGVNSADHTCLGGAVLYKGSYTPSETVPVVETVASLTAKLAGYTDAQIVATKGQAIGQTGEGTNTPYMNALRRTLVEKVGYDTFAHSFFDCSQRDKRTAMMQWLWNDEEALTDFVTGGTPNSGGYAKSLSVLANLYAVYGNDLSSTDALWVANPDDPARNRGDLYRIVMIAIALTHDNGPYMWQAASQASDPLERYLAYKQAYTANILRNDVYENLTVEEMRWVMGGRIWNDEIYWLNRYAYAARPTAGYPLVYSPHYFLRYGKDWDWAAKGLFNLDNYPTYDTKYSLTKYGVNPPTSYSKMWMIFEGSQICWGISYAGTSFANSFGVPSKYVRQPGHAAFFVYNRNGSGNATWGIDNNISGWTQTWVNEDTVGNGNARMMCDWGQRGNGITSDMNSSYIMLSSTAQDHIEGYEKAETLMGIESLRTTNAEKEALYRQIIGADKDTDGIMNYHLDAWTKLCQLYVNDSSKTSADLANLAEELQAKMYCFPLPMHDLMNVLYNGAKKKTDDGRASNLARIALYEERGLNRGAAAQSDSAAKALITQTDVCATMARYLLGNLSTELADFSFDGSKAGQVVFGSTYEGVRYRISLDGGATWNVTGDAAGVTSAGNMSFQLSAEQIASITAENDILIWLEGWASSLEGNAPEASKAFRIDITAGTTLSGNNPNDNENRFMDVAANVEYYTAPTSTPLTDPTWAPLTTSIEFVGDVVVHARNAAHGHMMAGPEGYFTFKNNGSSTRSYIPISRVTVDSYSSEESSKNDYARYVADGRLSTRWHTLWDGSDKDRWITLKLDRPTYINGVDYTPIANGGNGTIYACTVYVSTDNLTWVRAASASGWGNNGDVKHVNFTEPVYGQYVKIKVNNACGNFASARLFEVFEDTTFASRVMTGFNVSGSYKTDYQEGEKLDLTGMEVTFTYADGTTAKMNVNHLIPSEEYLYGTGDHTIYLSCGSFQPRAITVHVRARSFTPTSISIDRQPDRLTYYAGDELDLTGLQVSATDGTTTALLTNTDYTASADLTTTGQKTVTISSQGCSATFNVTVKPAVSSLKILNKPDKSAYTLGETFDSTGLTVNAVYPDGTEAALTAEDYVLLGTTGFAEAAGEVDLQVALADKLSITAPFTVTVYPYFTRDGINYELTTQYNEETQEDEPCIFVTGFCPDCGFIRIPESIKIGSRSYPVRGVESGAMTNVTGVSEIALPSSITTIESGAFVGSETIKNIYLTEHDSFDNLNAPKDAFDPDTNLVLFAGTQDLTQELKSKDFAQEMAVEDVTSKVASIKLSGSYPTTFNRGDSFSTQGLKVTGILKDEAGNPTANEIALAPEAYAVTGPTEADMQTAGNKTVTVAVTFTTDPPVAPCTYTVTVKETFLNITVNPVSAVYYRSSATIEPLTVEAVSGNPKDTLVYQWYRIAGSKPDPDTDIIDGAIQSSYTPTETGSYYAIVCASGTELCAQSMTATVEIGDYTAIVGNRGFDSLNAAVAAAAGQTVRLLKDVTITNGISVSHSFTLDGLDPDTGQTHKISRGTGFTYAFVSVNGSATVSLSNVILDGGALWNGGSYNDVVQRDTTNNGIRATAPLLVATNTSTLILNEGTVLQNNANNYNNTSNVGTNTGGAIRGNNQARIVLNGATIENCYSYFFGSAIYHRDSTSLIINEGSTIHGCSGYDNYNTTAICSDNNATLTINGGTICHNRGWQKGGAIWISNGKATINGGTFESNWTQTNKGQALYVNGSAGTEVSDYTSLQDIYLTGSQMVTVTGDLSGNTPLPVSAATGANCIQASNTDLLAAASSVATINGKQSAVKNGKLAPIGEGGVTEVATITRGESVSKFTGLTDALGAAHDSETIDLIADTSLASTNALSKVLYIRTNGHTISGLENLTAGSGFTVVRMGSGTDERIEVVPAALKFSAASLALQDNMMIKYKVKKTVLESFDEPYVTFVTGDAPDEVTTTVRSYTEEGDYLVFCFDNISPDKMGDNIVATVYGEKKDVLYHGAPKDYSVKTYCVNILNKYPASTYPAADYPQQAALRTMLVDILYYGAASQMYTGYKTDQLCTAGIDADVLAQASSGRSLASVLDNTYATVENPQVTWRGASLRLSSTIATRFIFQTADVTGLTIRIQTRDSSTQAPIRTWNLTGSRIVPITFGQGESGYEVAFAGLNGTQLSEPIYVTAYRNNVPVSNTVRYSAESYAFEMGDHTSVDSTFPGSASQLPDPYSNEALKHLVKAMMRYGDSAKAYKTILGK